MRLRLLAHTVAAAAVMSVLGTVKAFGRDASLPERTLPRIETVRQISGNVSLTSLEGTDIDVIQFDAKASTQARFLVQGGLHANEEQASEFVLWLARRYARGESALNELPNVAIDFLPIANPDGVNARQRNNARGVNLNRNFGVLWGLTKENPGKNSFSEPETQAIKALFQSKHYTAAVDVHGYVNWVVMPSSAEDLARSGFVPSSIRRQEYDLWRAAITEELPNLGRYEIKTGYTLGDGGAFEDWAFWGEGTFAYCLELETFQRFVLPESSPNSGDSVLGSARIDLFERYEVFIYKTFSRAMELKGAKSREVLATKKPEQGRHAKAAKTH